MVLDIDTLRDIAPNALYFPITLGAQCVDDTIKKSIQPTIKDWPNIKEPITDKSKYTNGVGLVLGDKSGVYVLDIDDKKEFEILKKKYKEILNCCVETRKGAHSYFRWTEKTQKYLGSRNFKKNNGYKSDIDFLGTNKMVIAPPSFYSCNDITYEYKFLHKNELRPMSLDLMNFLKIEYQTKTKTAIKKEKEIDKILNQYFQTDYLWSIEKNDESYKITNNSLECLIEGDHKDLKHSCMYVNYDGSIILKCFSHGTKKINIPELITYFQLGSNISVEKKEVYEYKDFRDFEDEILLSNNNITPIGHLFKNYYKNAIARVINAGRPLYFVKVKNNNNYEWKNTKDSPFSTKNSVFYVKHLIVDKGVRVIPITEFIKNHISKEDISTYDRIDFIPYLKEPPQLKEKILNTFSGYTFKYNPNYKEEIYTDDINELFKTAQDHMERIICNNDPLTINYFYNWISHLIQKPTKKDGVPAIIMKSGQGTGKNLITSFLSNIINPIYTITLCDFDKLTGNFNSILENKLLSICNEIQNYGGNFKSNDKLKSIITDTEQIIEPKGTDAYKINNYSRFIFITNNDWPVKIEKDDRRYFCMEVSDAEKGNADYYERVANAYNNPIIQKIFFDFFSNYEINVNIRKPPMNKLKADMKWKNRENLPLKHLTEYISDDNDFYETKILFEEFKQWCIDEGEKPNITLRQYSLILNKFKFEKVRKRINGNKNQSKGFIITKEILKKIINENIDETYEIGDDID